MEMYHILVQWRRYTNYPNLRLPLYGITVDFRLLHVIFWLLQWKGPDSYPALFDMAAPHQW